MSFLNMFAHAHILSENLAVFKCFPYKETPKQSFEEYKIYNVQTHKIVKTYSYPILDYYNGQVVYNGNGYHTYLNGKELGVFCDQAFISSSLEVLCVTRPDLNSLNNVLVSINPQTLSKRTIYTPQNVITAIYKEKSTLYIAEYDYVGKGGYVVVNGIGATTPGFINTFYTMGGKTYTASFRNVWNNNFESYSEILQINRKLIIEKVDNGEVIFSKSL